MKYSKIDRRQFLQGIGGYLLALPLLPSLLTTAQAQAAMANAKRFMAFIQEQGRIPYMWYPSALWDAPPGYDQNGHFNVTANEQANKLYVKEAPLSDLPKDPRSQGVSRVFGSEWNNLLDQMTMIRGMDSISNNNSHNRTLFLTSDFVITSSSALPSFPSIDQVIAASNVTYPGNNTAGAIRVLNTQTAGSSVNGLPSFTNSYYLQNNTVQRATMIPGANQLWSTLFPGGVGSGPSNTGPDPRLVRKAKVVDTVFEDLQNLLTGGGPLARRIASEDKQRLEEHAQKLSELENRITTMANAQTGANCATPDNPNMTWSQYGLRNATAAEKETVMKQNIEAMFDLLALAIKCGRTKVFTHQLNFYGMTLNWLNYVTNGGATHNFSSGNFHDKYTHADGTGARTPEVMDGMNSEVNRWWLQRVNHLVQQLNVEEAQGKTFLDNSIIMIGSCIRGRAQNSAVAAPIDRDRNFGEAHGVKDLPCVIIGKGGDHISAGRYIDYQDPNRLHTGLTEKVGRPIIELHVSVLKAMGIGESEFNTLSTDSAQGGFGNYTGNAAGNFNLTNRNAGLPRLKIG